MKTIKDVQDRCVEVGDCWQWNQSCNSHGTPMTYHEGRSGVPATRAAFCISRGLTLADIKGLAVWPTCMTPACCHPKHLRAATWAMFWKWRRQQGLTVQTPQAIVASTLAVRARPTTKLSMEAARRMRAMHVEGASLREIGKAEGVSSDMARKVIRGINWREASAGASVFNP